MSKTFKEEQTLGEPKSKTKKEVVKKEVKKEAPKEKKSRSKLTDNPDVTVDQVLTAMKKLGFKTEDGKTVKVHVSPNQLRAELKRPVGASYHKKLMDAVKAAQETGEVKLVQNEGKRTFYITIA